MAQYWQLKANSSDPRSGDYGYSGADMHRFGANEGLSVYKAIENAADRNVQIRYDNHYKICFIFVYQFLTKGVLLTVKRSKSQMSLFRKKSMFT